MWRSCWVALSLLGVAHAEEPFHRGVCFAHAWKDGAQAGYGTETSKRSLERLRALGVDAISLTPFGFQSSPSSTDIRLAADHPGGESDASIEATAKQARALGMRVMLKPHVWIRGGAWIGSQRLPDEESWRRWFASYRDLAVHYAGLAERVHADWFVVGTELAQASRRARPLWTALIAEIRRVYKGKITYAANWDEREVIFWDLLDAVGVNAYWPATSKRGATLADLRAGWRTVAAELAALQKRTGKPLLVTELGYETGGDAAFQALCYRAALEALTQNAPWCAGVYVWKWFSDSKDERDGPNDFSPAGKPAERVLGEIYKIKTRPRR